MDILHRRIANQVVGWDRASRIEHVKSRMAAVRMASLRYNAALGLTSAQPVPDPPLPIRASAETIAASRQPYPYPTKRPKVPVIIIEDVDMLDVNDKNTPPIPPIPSIPPSPSIKLPFLNGMGLVRRLDSYLNTHAIDFRNILELWIQDVTETPAKKIMHVDGNKMAKLMIHQMDLSNVTIDGNGVGKLEERKAGMQWIWFMLKEKKRNGGWTAFGCPAEAVRIIRDEMVTITGRDGNEKQIKRVDLWFSFGGVSIFDGVKVDHYIWGDIARLMSMGNCIVTYFFDPFVCHFDPIYGTIKPE